MRILVLGSSGMLGSTLARRLANNPAHEIIGTVRSGRSLRPQQGVRVEGGVDASDFATVSHCLERYQPDVVINCVGVIKQSATATVASTTVYTNGLFPHLLAAECGRLAIRLVHVSTDCVFSGRQGSYTEKDVPDPVDLYGRSKSVGEPVAENALTLRTSIVGHELHSNISLVDWFLSQKDRVLGYQYAIYTGVTTVEFANLIANVVLPRSSLKGLYHVASEPISKYDLLRLIKSQYGWPGDVLPDGSIHCDRSLLGERLYQATRYRPPQWTDMVRAMYRDHQEARVK